MSGANASPIGRSHQEMSGANASPTRSASAIARSLKKWRSHQEMSGANASPTRSASAIARSLKKWRSHQEMSGANASPTRSASAIARSLKKWRSHQEMSGANASPTRSASAIARSFKKWRSHQEMSGANASPTRSASAIARSLKKWRSHQEMTRRFFAVLILIALAMPLAAQTKTTWTAPKTPWGDPDLQGQWPAVANIPMQRPASFGTRAFLTDEELAQRESQATKQQQSDNEAFAKNGQSGTINPPSYWQERQKPNR